MDTQLMNAFITLNKKMDDHYQLIDKKIDHHSFKIAKICSYIENQKEEKETKKEDSSRKFYIMIAVMGIGFGLFEALQSMGFW